jgi:hypothetical protein
MAAITLAAGNLQRGERKEQLHYLYYGQLQPRPFRFFIQNHRTFDVIQLE